MSEGYYHARARLANALLNVAEHLGLHGIGRTTKSYSIKAVIDDYAAELQDGADSRKDKAAIIALILLLLSQYSRRAYEEGYQQGGGRGEISAEGEGVISDFVVLQSTFADGLAQAIIDARSAEDKQSAQDEITARVALWAATLDVLRLQGLAAADDPFVTWRYGDTDHCQTCLSLNGRRERLSWFIDNGYIPRQPASVTLDCKGYKCQCGLDDDDGNQVM